MCRIVVFVVYCNGIKYNSIIFYWDRLGLLVSGFVSYGCVGLRW